MNELIISIYDGGNCVDCVLNGKHQKLTEEKVEEIVDVFDTSSYYNKTRKINKYCKEHNIQRLILCVDGGIEIKNYKGEQQ